MKEKLEIYNLVIEVTRRCNMVCSHCLRGDAENMDLEYRDLRALLTQVRYISNLTFTGGEPSLNVTIMEQALKLCKDFEIGVGGFYIATNGKAISEEFVIACLRWFAYCDDNEVTQVVVSNDGYHSDDSAYDTTLLDGLAFFKRRFPEEATYPENLVAEGRMEGHFDYRKLEPESFEYCDGRVEEGDVYLNCEGNVILGCDWSYKSQRDEDNILCKASEDMREALIERFGDDE